VDRPPKPSRRRRDARRLRPRRPHHGARALPVTSLTRLQASAASPTSNGDGATVTIEVSFDGGPLAGPLGASVAASGEKAAEQSPEKLKSLVA
jgi:hypothetical protein